jgi:hypothetical protein
MNAEVPVPLALRHLIESNNELLKIYQQELTDKVIIANEEIMRILGLDAKDGWRLDMSTFTYVKTESTDDTSVS